MQEAKGGFFAGVQFAPPGFGGAQKRADSEDVGAHEGFWIKNRTFHMAFGGKVDHSVGPIGLEEMLHKLCIADVAMHENMPRIAGQ